MSAIDSAGLLIFLILVGLNALLAAAHKRGRKLGPAQIDVCGCRINLV